MSDIPEQLRLPMLQRLYRYWDEKRGGRSMPLRRDVEPADLKDLLPHLMIVEPTGEAEEERRFRYRLVGSALVEAFGFNFVGTHVGSTTTGNYSRLLLDIYGKAFTLGRPVLARSTYEPKDDAPKEVSRLLLPLSNDGRSAHQVLSMHLFEYRHHRREPASLKTIDVFDNVVEVL